MDKVRYNRSGFYSYIYYTTLDIFMGAFPPCRECLVNTMCINYNHNEEVLQIKACDRLNEFVENNYWFDMS